MRTGITTSTLTKDLFQTRMLLHTSKLTPSHTMNQQFYQIRTEPRTESCAIHTLCIHHKGTPTGSKGYTQQMYNIANTLQIFAMFIQPTSLTPQDTPVNRSIKWSKHTYPPHPPTTQTSNIPLITNINRCLPLKYLPQFCYYTNGSFKPPKETSQGHLKREKVGYGIYNSIKKNLKLQYDY